METEIEIEVISNGYLVTEYAESEEGNEMKKTTYFEMKESVLSYIEGIL